MEITPLTKPVKPLTWQSVVTAYSKMANASLDFLEENTEILAQAFLTLEDFERRHEEVFNCVLMGFSQQKQEVHATGSTLVGVRHLLTDEKKLREDRTRVRERANRIIYTIKFALFPAAMAREREIAKEKQKRKAEEIEAIQQSVSVFIG